MKKWSSVLVLALLLVAVIGCTVAQRQAAGGAMQDAGEAVNSIAPLLPGPFGGVAAAGATVLTLLGGLIAGRAKSNAYASGGPAAVAAMNPLLKVVSERKWLFPTIGAAIAAGNAANIWHIEPDAMGGLLAALAVPSIGEFAKDGIASMKATTPTTGTGAGG